jgi:hypothetical protein
MSVSARKRYSALISIEEKSGLLAGYRQGSRQIFPSGATGSASE